MPRRVPWGLCCALLALPAAVAAQQATAATSTPKWYASWGYNAESYGATSITFDQPGLGNDFTLQQTHMNDKPGWDFWDHPITVPQYSIRIGRFIKKNTALELNFDHAKAILSTDAYVMMTGTLAGVPVNQEVLVSDVVQVYKLNNGANFLLLNLVQRLPLLGEPGHTGSVALLGKGGIGIMIPHTENTVLGAPNHAGFEFGGVGAGVELALRVHAYKGLYLEAAQKGFYGRYRYLNLSEGKAGQDLWAFVSIVSIGVAWGHLGP